ncbi:hypothetical protein [Candidatus Poriferisocius sp.]|uniref:hypothetical protein n=1 Tax=Candidatus Poriferisocius sp. TaxID=3101276 RepID=UPI003B025CAD
MAHTRVLLSGTQRRQVEHHVVLAHRQPAIANAPPTAIDAGWYHSCAISTDSAVVCWGLNIDGQSDAPDGTYTTVDAGARHSCAIAVDRSVRCWHWTTNLPLGVDWRGIFTGEYVPVV